MFLIIKAAVRMVRYRSIPMLRNRFRAAPIAAGKVEIQPNQWPKRRGYVTRYQSINPFVRVK